MAYAAVVTDNVDPELAEVIRAGAKLLPAVDRAIEHCRTVPDPGGGLAQECGDLVSAYLGLRKQVWKMPTSALVQKVEQLLNYEQQILQQASLLAFRPHDKYWVRLAKDFGASGGPSDELIQLAAEVSRPGG